MSVGSFEAVAETAAAVAEAIAEETAELNEELLPYKEPQSSWPKSCVSVERISKICGEQFYPRPVSSGTRGLHIRE